MEKIKSFLKNPKNTAWLGLIINILYICIIRPFSIQYLYIIGLIIYFFVILLRIKGRKINIKKTQKILIISYVASLLYYLIVFIECISYLYVFLYIFLNNLASVLYVTSYIIYLCGIFNQKFYINNKIFFIITILCTFLMPTNIFYRIAFILQNILTVPYFYNFYLIVKEEK